MARSLWIKLPTLLAALACVLLLPSPWSWWSGVAVLIAGGALLMRVVFDPRSAFWAPTVWRAPSWTPANDDAVALTFDDGPDPDFTPQVLDVLAAHGVQAAFFVVGERVRAHPELVRRMHAAGHLVCNHTDRHGFDFHFQLWRGAGAEIARCNAAITAAIGRTPRLFRSPQGFKNPALGDVLHRTGMTAVGWQARGLDAVTRDAAAIERRLVDGARPGGVLVMHDGAGLGGTGDRTPTLTALPRVLSGLRARGLRFARLDELLQVDAYTTAAS
ncbi:MAG: polysaccharide deacetylase family protein [bacterium]|nr:polysaccharide deacetylase family protein [bacterium]